MSSHSHCGNLCFGVRRFIAALPRRLQPSPVGAIHELPLPGGPIQNFQLLIRALCRFCGELKLPRISGTKAPHSKELPLHRLKSANNLSHTVLHLPSYCAIGSLESTGPVGTCSSPAVTYGQAAQAGSSQPGWPVSKFGRHRARQARPAGFLGDRSDRTSTWTSSRKKGTADPSGRWSIGDRRRYIPKTAE